MPLLKRNNKSITDTGKTKLKNQKSKQKSRVQKTSRVKGSNSKTSHSQQSKLATPGLHPLASYANKHVLNKYKNPEAPMNKDGKDHKKHQQVNEKNYKHREKKEEKKFEQKSLHGEHKHKTRTKELVKEKTKKYEKEKKKEDSKTRRKDYSNLSIPSDSSKPVRRRKSEILEELRKQNNLPPTKELSKNGSQPSTFNLNEVLRIGGILGRFGMDKKRREAFDWLASHPLKAAEGTPEAIYYVRIAVGDLPMSKLLVTQILRLLMEKGEITQQEYQRHFFILERNIADQAITISQFAYFINTHCEKYKNRPIITYNNN